MNKIYAAQHTGCIYESAFYTLSLHKKRINAERAIAKHKAERMEERSKVYSRLNIRTSITDFEDWRVVPYNIEP